MFEDIALELDLVTFEEGDILFREGDESPHVYILKEGAVVVTIDGDEVSRVCTPETVFGEVSALLESESTATVKALEPTSAWLIKDLDAFMDTHPAFAKTVARELARRLCNLNFSVMEMRASLQQLEDQHLEQNVNEPTAELTKANTAILRFNPKKAEPKKENAGEANKEKDAATKGLLEKVNELLHKRIF